MLTTRTATAAAMFFFSFGLVLFELLLTRLFAVVLFASFAHLALALALLGISVGALAQHLWPSLVPDRDLERRLATLCFLMGGASIAAVLFTATAPVTVQFEEAPVHYGERSSISWSLLDPFWFTALLPVLALPFAIAGLAFAGAFQRRKEHIGLLYGADLIGGAAGAVAFVPLLSVIPGPDVVFAVAAICALGAGLLLLSVGERITAGGALAASLVAVGLSALAGVNGGLVVPRFAAGYSEENITYTQWTPLTRLAIHEDKRGHFLLLDNTSASEIVRSAARIRALAVEPNRSLVYQIHRPPARVAIIAASAGPEIAVAQSFGYSGIEAIDIAPELGDVVAERYPDNPVNPYLVGDTERVVLDGRAAILHSDHPYDIIQMTHANLHSSAGQLANAWSPALLETKEAFELYLSKLTPDGTVSFGVGSKTKWTFRAVAEALEELGYEDPGANMVWVTKPNSVVLAKLRPWTEPELDHIRAVLDRNPGWEISWDPLQRDPQVWKKTMATPLLTDDRPYLESPAGAWEALGEALAHTLGASDDDVEPMTVLYHSLVLQALFVGAVGLACVIVPVATRRFTGLGGVRGTAAGLTYVACLGYGYLSVETVLVHQLALFVGHPVYAITVVILAMLLFSGLGSILVGRLPEERLTSTLVAVLAGVVLLGALQAYVVPDLLYATALGLPIAVRTGLVFLVLAPLGFVMGMPFPLAMRLLRPEVADLVPWAWATNGWMSVVASIGTVVVSRLVGYDVAFAVALGSYVVAALLARSLARIHRVAVP